ncbi:Snf7-domain-containing protein [Fragilariopsis cylindrus CCMP1102]|uniref:Snf7-domain-containing protein n=1 Tax=Fragilariopsis cylindrus CCMP1102 TaxID=635003 RepID=A0A1E7FNW1_9STRA|nr:Snf7-domain-containing protein [Fragilariopsis cylindrus CCMP1102]|eukprot:OEU19814.1 Snf7-domain-containing protein [Fragilariopsis cylindrus CCMP1102]
MGGAFSNTSSSDNNNATTTTTTKKKPEISATDRATLDLKNARDKLQRYKMKLEQDDIRIVSRAKKAKVDGNTKAALNLLKVRKMKTREVESVEQQLLNVLQMVQTINSKQNEVQVLQAMKEGKDTLQKMHEETTVEDVLTLMDDIQEQNELENEINDILQNSPQSLSIADEEAVEAELEALMMMGVGLDQQEKNSPITTTTPEKEQQLPIAPDTQPLPQAPSTKLPEATTSAATAATTTISTTTTQEKVAVAS